MFIIYIKSCSTLKSYPNLKYYTLHRYRYQNETCTVKYKKPRCKVCITKKTPKQYPDLGKNQDFILKIYTNCTDNI